MVDIAANYHKVIENIRAVVRRCGREDSNRIRLLAASKSQGIAEIRAAADAGIRLFGENYVQEAKSKTGAIDQPMEWHMIGHLQRNKVKAALDLFSLIQSLDSVELARVLDKEGKKRGRMVRAFVEVNLGGEESKSGIDKDKVASLLREVENLSHLRVEGLMTIPPFREEPEAMRPYFRELKELQTELKGLKIPNVDLKELSMGMTHDYPVAIEEGATLVRVGTAIFGARRG
ncbi:MAG: YggS family pyridoxal phosphate-dependent enzyme [Candidatus Binatia bacterium]